MEMYEKLGKKISDSSSLAQNSQEFLISKIAGRSILIWGAVKRNDFILEFAKRNNIEVLGYIDSYSAATDLNGYPIWKPDDIAPPIHQYVFIGLNILYDDVLNQLCEWGLSLYEDYLYWTKSGLTITHCGGVYADFFGNQITGDVTGFSVRMEYLSNLYIGKNCRIDSTVNIILGKNAFLEIGDNCVIRENFTIGVAENSCVHIGKNCIMRESGRIMCSNNGKISISDDFRCGMRFHAGCNGGYIRIQKGCIFSSDIILLGSDGHPLYDLQRKCYINDPKRYVIEIGEHVWIGRRCNIRYGAKIGAGSVIGMGSFVCKEVPNNVIAAGNPLRVIRENIAWSRKKCFDPDRYLEEYDFRQ